MDTEKRFLQAFIIILIILIMIPINSFVIAWQRSDEQIFREITTFNDDLIHTFKAYYNVDLDALNIPHKEWIVKNLFLRDDKNRKYYLVTVPGYKTIDLKNLSKKIPSCKLSFANEETLSELLH